MKKKIITLLVFGMIIINPTFANDINTNVNKKVATAFEKKFVKATEVNWLQVDEYYKAWSQLNGQYLTAYFSEEGEVMGVARHLLSTELPINLQAALKNKHSAFWVSDLFEFAINGDSKYYITIEDANRQIILKSVVTDDWSVIKKINK